MMDFQQFLKKTPDLNKVLPKKMAKNLLEVSKIINNLPKNEEELKALASKALWNKPTEEYLSRIPNGSFIVVYRGGYETPVVAKIDNKSILIKTNNNTWETLPTQEIQVLMPIPEWKKEE